MKRALSLFALFTFTLTVFYGTSYAATTATPSATPTSEKSKQIEDLKERLATKVAQLRQTQKKAIFGTVKALSISTATIETTTKDVKVELPDEVKVVQILKGKRTTLTIDDLAKGDAVTVFGTYDTTLDLLKAQLLFIQTTPPVRAAGTVTDIDKTEFTLALQTPEGQIIVVDIEKYTLTNVWSLEKGVAKGGFSKIALGDTVHVVGVTVPKKENRISANRILDLGNLTGAATPTPAPTEEPEATSSGQPEDKTTP